MIRPILPTPQRVREDVEDDGHITQLSFRDMWSGSPRAAAEATEDVRVTVSSNELVSACTSRGPTNGSGVVGVAGATGMVSAFLFSYPTML